MCIIVAKKKGVLLPFKKTLKKCFENNSDGAGLMYVKDGKVIIDKGYMSFGEFYKRIKRLKQEFNGDLTDKALVFHFRIGTAGNNSQENCHPYPITDNLEDFHALDITTDLGIVHNGIITEYNPKGKDEKDDMNDTQVFIRDYINKFRELNSDFWRNDFVKKLILKESKQNKFAILDGDEDIQLIGDFQEKEGIYYSNGTYKSWYYNGCYDWGYYGSGYDYYDKKKKDKDDDYDYKMCQYGRSDIELDELGNPYYDYDDDKMDLSTDDYEALWNMIENGELVFIDSDKHTYFVGGDSGYKELDKGVVYAIDIDNNIYEIDDNMTSTKIAFRYEEGKMELFNEQYGSVGYYDFVTI